MVALFNLYVFKCLQDVHVNFMNPSVFVTQPSAKEKINFPSETERDWVVPIKLGGLLLEQQAVYPRFGSADPYNELGRQLHRAGICLWDLLQVLLLAVSHFDVWTKVQVMSASLLPPLILPR